MQQLKKGEGLPLVFFHGFLGNGSDWEPVCSYLPACTCLAIDLPGHGTAPFVEEFSIDIPRFHLIGYSLGGRLAIQYRRQHPEQIASLTLLSTHPGLKSEEEKKERWKSDLQWAKLLKELPIDEFLHRWYDQPIFNSYRPDFSMRNKQNVFALSAAMLHYSLAKQAREEIEGGIVGERDEKFRNLQKNPILIEGAGHMVHLENPKRVAQEIWRKITS